MSDTHTDYDASNRMSRTWTARDSNNATRSWDLSYCRARSAGSTPRSAAARSAAWSASVWSAYARAKRQMTSATGATTTGYRYAGTTQDELVHQDLLGANTIDYVYGRTDRHGLPIMQSITKSGGGTVYLDHDPGGTPRC